MGAATRSVLPSTSLVRQWRFLLFRGLYIAAARFRGSAGLIWRRHDRALATGVLSLGHILLLYLLSCYSSSLLRPSGVKLMTKKSSFSCLKYVGASRNDDGVLICAAPLLLSLHKNPGQLSTEFVDRLRVTVSGGV